MDTLQRLHQLLDERGSSEYRLAKNCGLSNSTIANIYHRNTIPSISTLEAICTSFGISLSQFFAEGEMVELTPELKELFDNWVNLTPQQKDAVLQTMRATNHDQTRYRGSLCRLPLFSSAIVLLNDKTSCFRPCSTVFPSCLCYIIVKLSDKYR